jgi:hypothetical protein
MKRAKHAIDAMLDSVKKNRNASRKGAKPAKKNSEIKLSDLAILASLRERWFCAAMLFVSLLAASPVANADTVLFDERFDDGACNPEAQNPGVHCATSGGSFSGGGWKTDAGSISRLVFDMSQAVPQGIPCGRAEFTVTNFDPVTNFNVLGECYVIVMGAYEADHGEHWAAAGADQSWIQVKGKTESRCPGVEPGSWWKENRFKIGSFACSWDYPECPSKAPDYIPGMNEYSIDWKNTLGLHYTVSTEWDCKGVSYSVSDGTHAWTAAGEYGWHAGHADAQPHIRYIFLGKDHSGGGSFIGDAVYTRLSVVKRSACDCPATLPDGGMPDGGGPDAGTAEDGGSGPTRRFTVVADTYANRGEPDTNFGGAADMRVGAETNGDPSRIAFLRFDVAGIAGNVKSARIHLQVMNNGGGGAVHRVGDSSWGEMTLTWNNKPAHDPAALSTLGMVSVDQMVAFDVTPAVSGNGTHSFAIVSDVEDGSGYFTKESDELKPYLEVIQGTGPGGDAGTADDTGVADTGPLDSSDLSDLSDVPEDASDAGGEDEGTGEDTGTAGDTGGADGGPRDEGTRDDRGTRD